MLSSDIKNTIINAEAKALATNGVHGVNVVPVSVVELKDDTICLFDFFMDKTVQNIAADPSVALTFWTGLQGVQIKAVCSYQVDGELFVAATAQMKEQFPDRTLRGVLVLSPTAVYDISAGANAGTQLA